MNNNKQIEKDMNNYLMRKLKEIENKKTHEIYCHEFTTTMIDEVDEN